MDAQNKYMIEALAEARTAGAIGEVPIGAVLVNGLTGEKFYVTNRAEVCITSSIPNAVLRFTEDCTEPNAGSTPYNGCFTVLYGGIFPELDTVVVRVGAFSPGGQLLAQQVCPVTMVFTNECEGYFRLAATA